MTSVWDKLGRITYDLAYDSNAWNGKTALKVVEIMKAVYMSIKDRPEYQNIDVRLFGGSHKKLLEILAVETKDGNIPSISMMLNLHECIEALHDFDHADVPLNDVKLMVKGKTFGHHTETVIARKRANRPYAKVFQNVLKDSWWNS